jgi:Ni/Co efflux regulator RcnB
MLKMKKILAILLAVCFLVSITAASASARDGSTIIKEKTVIKKTVVEKEKKFGDRDHRDRFGDRDHHDRFGDRDHRDRFGEHHKKRHHHPAHWEKKRVGHREFRNNHWQTVFVYKMVFVKEYYDYHY